MLKLYMLLILYLLIIIIIILIIITVFKNLKYSKFYNSKYKSILINDNINNLTLDSYYIKKYFNNYGLNNNSNIKVFLIQTSLSCLPNINITKIKDIIKPHFSDKSEILLKEINKLSNNSFIQSTDFGLFHSALAFFKDSDIRDNKPNISKIICTLELWGNDSKNLFLYQLLPHLSNKNNLDYKYIPENTINMGTPKLYKFYKSNSLINSIFIGNTNLDNILNMFEYSKKFNKKYPFYSTININNNYAINCHYFTLSMINFLQQHDNKFTNKKTIESINCPVIQIKANIFNNITNDILNNYESINTYNDTLLNLFKNFKEKNKSNKDIINKNLVIGKYSYILSQMTSYILKIIDSYLPYNNIYYILFNNLQNGRIELGRLNNISLEYYYDNRLSKKISNLL